MNKDRHKGKKNISDVSLRDGYSNNIINGSISAGFNKLTSLNYLDIEVGDNLIGTIPKSWVIFFFRPLQKIPKFSSHAAGFSRNSLNKHV